MNDDCENKKNDTRGSDMTIKVLSGVISLGVILVLGGYTYTWSEMKGQEDEKRQWRQEHQRVLDKRFDEIKQGQEKLVDMIDKNTDNTRDMLQQILIEQKRVSDNVKASSRNK